MRVRARGVHVRICMVHVYIVLQDYKQIHPQPTPEILIHVQIDLHSYMYHICASTMYNNKLVSLDSRVK